MFWLFAIETALWGFGLLIGLLMLFRRLGLSRSYPSVREDRKTMAGGVIILIVCGALVGLAAHAAVHEQGLFTHHLPGAWASGMAVALALFRMIVWMFYISWMVVWVGAVSV